MLQPTKDDNWRLGWLIFFVLFIWYESLQPVSNQLKIEDVLAVLKVFI